MGATETGIAEAVKRAGGPCALATATGFAQPRISEWLRLGYVPRRDRAAIVAADTGVPVDRLTKPDRPTRMQSALMAQLRDGRRLTASDLGTAIGSHKTAISRALVPLLGAGKIVGGWSIPPGRTRPSIVYFLPPQPKGKRNVRKTPV